MRQSRGQTTVEWTALVLLAALALAAVPALAPEVDGRGFGGFLTHRIVCAVTRGCDDAALANAFGDRTAALVRAHAPSLTYEHGERQIPIDWRRCRKRACANAPDDRDLDVHRSDSGSRATAFVNVRRRDGTTYIQYWLYYPDSNSSVLGASDVWNSTPLRLIRTYPGFHTDDWEGYAVRIDPDGGVWARATSHGHWQGCKHRFCRGRWMPTRGWSRVSRGSHAGHLPGRRRQRERSSTGEALRLIPLEALDKGEYRPLDGEVAPPWDKPAYGDPESPRS
jgi:hypothetical protein